MSTGGQIYPPRVSVVFCDDARSESGGKTSLMGVYSQVLGFKEPKALLPKFCVVFLLDLPGELGNVTVGLSLLDRGKTLFSAAVALEYISVPALHASQRIGAVLPLQAMAFEAADGMVLQGRAVIEGVLDYTSDPLLVLSIPEPTPSAVASAA